MWSVPVLDASLLDPEPQELNRVHTHTQCTEWTRARIAAVATPVSAAGPQRLKSCRGNVASGPTLGHPIPGWKVPKSVVLWRPHRGVLCFPSAFPLVQRALESIPPWVAKYCPTPFCPKKVGSLRFFMCQTPTLYSTLTIHVPTQLPQTWRVLIFHSSPPCASKPHL